MILNKLKPTLIVLLLAMPFTALSQTVKEMKPELGYEVDKSPEGELAFLNKKKKCAALYERDRKTWTTADKKLAAECNEEVVVVENYYDILGQECSWYCGGGEDTRTASSELKSQGQSNYAAGNAHDLSYQTAWVEGVPGYGVGESLTYRFPPQTPRITKIIVVNGYAKSLKAWSENSRVKKLKFYINDKPVAILNLQDTRAEQIFTFDPIGNANREDKTLRSMPQWTMKFEIMDVYKGDKYDDTAITEIYFDGIDVH